MKPFPRPPMPNLPPGWTCELLPWVHTFMPVSGESVGEDGESLYIGAYVGGYVANRADAWIKSTAMVDVRDVMANEHDALVELVKFKMEAARMSLEDKVREVDGRGERAHRP